MDQFLSSPAGQKLLRQAGAQRMLAAIAEDIRALTLPQVRLAGALVSAQASIPPDLKGFILRQLHARAPLQTGTPIWTAAMEIGRVFSQHTPPSDLEPVAQHMELLRCLGLMTDFTFAGLFLVGVSDHMRALAVSPAAHTGPTSG